MKKFVAKKQTEQMKSKLQIFQPEAKQHMFDICFCKRGSLNGCECPRDRKVPDLEKLFS